MKKIISNSIAMFFAVALSVPVFSQNLAMNHKSKGSEISPAVEQSTSTNNITDVNTKVLRVFNKTYGEKPGANWSKTDGGFAVSFRNGDMKTNVYYKNNGIVDYKINYYFEDQMPQNIRQLVRSNFSDYTVTQVSEVHRNNSIGYFVKIEDKYYVKTVRVVDEEFEVIETLIKK